MNKSFRIAASLVLIASMVSLSGCGCAPVVKKYKVNLEVWGVMDDSDAYAEIFKNFRDIDPNAGEITYKKQRIETYQQDLINALASGKGPDIFMIGNNWLPAFADKTAPAPKEILTEQQFRGNFVDVCANDFVSKGDVYAVPLSVNSLQLYYNKDLFNAAGISAPPTTWNEFIRDTEMMTRVSPTGEINPSGAAMGAAAGSTAGSINRATDILTLLMFQNGVALRDDSGQVNFGKNPNALKALDFYTSFARNSAPNYSWNPLMHYSIDAFSEGSVAMMLNYSWQESVIRGKSPKLNFAVAPVPQMVPSAPAGYANYWGYAVAANKVIVNDPSSKLVPVTNDMRVAEAWKLLTYLTTKEGIPVVTTNSGTSVVQKPNLSFDPADVYMTKTKQPAARRDLIDKQRSDVDLGVFAQGNLIAKSWVEPDPALIEGTFNDMINAVNNGSSTSSNALETTAERIRRAEMK